MKNKLIFLLFVVVFLLLTISHCKTETSWSPLGTWSLYISIPEWELEWIDTLTFIGTESDGAVQGLTANHISGPQTGSWTKTGEYSISMSFSFDLAVWVSENVDLRGNSSEANPNSMAGEGTWTEDTCASVTWTATKI